MSDELKEYDLSAWEVPAPPDDMADAVVERMGVGDVTGVAPAVPVETREISGRAWLFAGVAVAVLAASVGTYALIRSTRHAAPTSGSVLAHGAQPLSLEGARADLDPGADVRWARKQGVLHIEQRAGNAAWHVSSGETVVIDAGATVASVEATGASLRVEVQMNAMDARIIGASAVTAAAVAMVTVVVYEGHVKVTPAGQQTVVVQPGSTYKVVPPPTPDPNLVSGDVSIDPTGDDVTLDTSCDEVSCVLNNYDGACCAKFKLGAQAESLDRAAISSGIASLKASIQACGTGAAGKVIVRVAVKPDGSVGSATVTKAHDAAVGSCVSGVIAAGRFTPTKSGGTFSYPFVFVGQTAACDASALKDDGMALVNKGKHAEALAKLEASLACKPDSYVVQLAFFESCNSKNSPKAKLYYKQLTPAQQTKFAVMCIRNKVAYEDTAITPPANCDAGALKDKGMENINMGQHAAALAQFEAAMRCRSDDSIVALAFTSACNAGNSPKAIAYYAKLTPLMQTKLAVICIRNKVVYQAGGTACDADDLKDKGMEAVNMGEHEKALNKFEASLRCKEDPYVTALAFMASCNSGDSEKAKLYYSKLSAKEQNKYKVMCERQHVPYLAGAVGTNGHLKLLSKPVAEIMIDGKATGKSTPVDLEVEPGNHKITFVVAGERFTYPVTLKPGASLTMSKDLR